MLKYATMTNIGSRDVNEDAIGVFEKEGSCCFVVCDGLGGHGMGDAASQNVRDVFEEVFNKTDNLRDFLTHAFDAGQEKLLSEQSKLHVVQRMKTTAVALVSDNKKAYIGHVGDSRLYIFGRDKIITRTMDHSVPQMLALTGQIKEEEIRNHPDRNILLKVMGIKWEKPMYELMPSVKLSKCRAFLLCTDGFWEFIEDRDMCETLKRSESPKQWLEEMEQLVRANGMGKKMDNYSAIAVWNEK